jgi:hypothetical protein
MVVTVNNGDILTANKWNGIQWFSGANKMSQAGPFAEAVWIDVSGSQMPAAIVAGSGTMFAEYNFDLGWAQAKATFRLVYSGGAVGSPGTVFKVIDPCYGSVKTGGEDMHIKGFVNNLPSGTYRVWMQVNQTAGSPNVVNIATQNSGTSMIFTTVDII